MPPRNIHVRNSCTSPAPAAGGSGPGLVGSPFGRTRESPLHQPGAGLDGSAGSGFPAGRWEQVRSTVPFRSSPTAPAGGDVWVPTVTQIDQTFALAPRLGAPLDQLLLLHPLYPNLIRALVDCRQVLSGGGSEAARLEDASKRALAASREAKEASDIQGLGLDTIAAEDQDLNEFLVEYIYVLEQYRTDLADMVQRMDDAGKDFDQGIAQLLQAAVSGAALQDGGTPVGNAADESQAHKRQSTGSAAADSETTMDDPKVSLKRKYAEKLQELQHVLVCKRPKGKLPSVATDILKAWWEANTAHPYPSDEVKRNLIEQTGLSSTQLNNWFINQRKRHWEGRVEDGSDLGSRGGSSKNDRSRTGMKHEDMDESD